MEVNRFLGNLHNVTNKVFGKVFCSICRVIGYGKYRGRIDNRPLLGGTSFEFKILFCYATRGDLISRVVVPTTTHDTFRTSCAHPLI
ncbi:hypothetical protein GIB67_013606 [Kingdonia uniflora]|uniref:Uncharacterized protein n=1 Tax=Kingdonia uniflora TaxID=39325 RepID=A0A7J7NPS5_9MAGN|nr:hypothetical protein GIB67_013606 [Kingdonia uniflora]